MLMNFQFRQLFDLCMFLFYSIISFYTTAHLNNVPVGMKFIRANFIFCFLVVSLHQQPLPENINFSMKHFEMGKAYMDG